MKNIKAGFIVIVLIALALLFLRQHQAQDKLRADNAALAQLQTDNASLSNRIVAVGDSKSLSDEQFNELLKLRGEVAVLRQQANELGKLREENQRLRDGLADIQNQSTHLLPTDAEYKQRQAEIQSALQEIAQAIQNVYVARQNDEFLTNLDQLIASAGLVTNFPGGVVLNDFKIINPGVAADKIMIREKVPRRTPDGKFEVEYGSSGQNSVSPTTSSYDDFDDWDRRHVNAPPPNQ